MTPARLIHSLFRERIVLMLHTDRAPTDEEWESLCTDSGSGALTGQRILVVSDGGAPTSRQRARLLDAVDVAQPARVALVTHSARARGAWSVLNWFYRGIRSFRPHQLSSALDYLGVNGDDERAALHAQLAHLRGELNAQRSAAC